MKTSFIPQLIKILEEKSQQQIINIKIHTKTMVQAVLHGQTDMANIVMSYLPYTIEDVLATVHEDRTTQAQLLSSVMLP